METKATISVANRYGTILNVSEVVLYTIISPKGEMEYKIEGRGYSGGHHITAMIDIKKDKAEAIALYIRLLEQLIKAQEAEADNQISKEKSA